MYADITETIVMEMGCCGCFGLSRKPRQTTRPKIAYPSHMSQAHLLDEEEIETEEEDDRSYNGEATNMTHVDEVETPSSAKRSEEILSFRTQNGLICRPFPAKETHKLVRSEDENGNKMINEYIRECKIGAGSYAKVVLYRSSIDGKQYAIKAFHKSHLLRQRVAPSETAMTDVLREVLIMKMLSHPNIVNLIEVIDDPTTDHFYMVLEYVEEKWDYEGSGPPGGLGEKLARNYLRDIVSGLMYLHSHNIVHMDIKPQNLLVSRNGTVKIADFSVSQDKNDELRRSPGTPVITAPECCLGLTYHGKAADTWAVGITLYCMLMGKFPFIGETLQETYDKACCCCFSSAFACVFMSTFNTDIAVLGQIVNDPLDLPETLDPQIKDLLQGLLCRDPTQRLTLKAVAEHPWVVGEEGPIPEFVCWCKRKSFEGRVSEEETEFEFDIRCTPEEGVISI
ncbi:Serine/threonine-protein kinase GRIK2-like protein [Drosera capensis]